MATNERVGIGLGNRRYNGDVSIASRPQTSIINRDLWQIQVLKDEFVSSPQFKSVADTDVQGHIREGAIKEFRRSYSYQFAVDMAFNRVETFEGVNEFNRWFAGHLFSHFAWQEIASFLPSDQVLLSEQYSTEICRDIGGRKTIRTINGLEMGDRRYLPDGMLIDADGKISAVYEYTLSTDHFKFLNQVKGFRALRSEMPDLLRDAQLVFVVPSVGQGELDSMIGSINREIRAGGGQDTNFRIQTLGTTRSEFSAFLSRTLGERFPDRPESLSQLIQEREFLRFTSIGSKVKREELARRIEQILEGNTRNAEDIEYVVAHAPKYEREIKGVRKATIVTLPRTKPFSLGEPGLFQAKNSS